MEPATATRFDPGGGRNVRDRAMPAFAAPDRGGEGAHTRGGALGSSAPVADARGLGPPSRRVAASVSRTAGLAQGDGAGGPAGGKETIDIRPPCPS